MAVCKECGGYITGGEVCLWCKSKHTHCSIDRFGYETETMSIPVPWCYDQGRRVLLGDFKWLCDDCKHDKRDS